MFYYGNWTFKITPELNAVRHSLCFGWRDMLANGPFCVLYQNGDKMRFKQYILDILEEAAIDVEAMHYAAAKHAGQVRKFSGKEYATHPRSTDCYEL